MSIRDPNDCGMNTCGKDGIVICDRHMAAATFLKMQRYLSPETLSNIEIDLTDPNYPDFGLVDLLEGWDDAKRGNNLFASTGPRPLSDSV